MRRVCSLLRSGFFGLGPNGCDRVSSCCDSIICEGYVTMFCYCGAGFCALIHCFITDTGVGRGAPERACFYCSGVVVLMMLAGISVMTPIFSSVSVMRDATRITGSFLLVARSTGDSSMSAAACVAEMFTSSCS